MKFKNICWWLVPSVMLVTVSLVKAMSGENVDIIALAASNFIVTGCAVESVIMRMKTSPSSSASSR